MNRTDAPDDRGVLRDFWGVPMRSAALLYRVFGVAGWRCPQCGGAMRLRAHAGALSTERILEGLARSARGPPGAQVFVA